MTITISKIEKHLQQNYYQNLLAKIKNKTATVGIVGMGYVGLPNIVSKARQGYYVTGFDVNLERVDKVNKGISYISDVESEELKELVINESKVAATTEYSLLANMDVIVICVPTPVDEHKQPNLTYIKTATKGIAENITRGSLVILESTTYPSTTEDIIVKELESKGFAIGEDMFVAYSPERIDPSNKTYNVDNTPRIVGGHTQYCTTLAKEFLGGNVKTVSSTKIAEMAKVYENTFRYINIALANELDIICNKMDIDTWEVIEASGTKPYGFMAFYPTVGIGGHCIPVDPHYLSWYAKKFNYTTQMIQTASVINDSMNDYSVERVSEILNKQGKTLNGSNIAILGAAYKKDVNDVRESPIIRFYQSLKERRAEVTVYDDYVDQIAIKGEDIRVKNIDYQELYHYDIVILLTDHSYFDYEKIAFFSKCIFDTRNAFKNVGTKNGKYYKI
jgi:UDP-N-acetyl-D-glucosamine dehydrogenase